MAHSNWKDLEREPFIPADLSVDNCVDEMFRPLLRAETVQPFTPPLPPPLPEKAMETRFEVMFRSLANLLPLSIPVLRSESATSRHISSESVSAPSMLERFARTVIPRTATQLAPSLPHDVREEMLELRAEVLNAVRTRRLQTLMMCGVETGAGTSFIAVQLTRMLAEFAQTKVAFLTLVPNREKKPHRQVSRAALPQLQFLLRRTERPNLVELASANGTITLTEMLCHCATSEVLRQLKQEFDFIVIDAPAIAMYGEAASLAGMVDGVILVAEPHVTPLRRMDRAHRRLHRAQANILGMVFNRQHRP